ATFVPPSALSAPHMETRAPARRRPRRAGGNDTGRRPEGSGRPAGVTSTVTLTGLFHPPGTQLPPSWNARIPRKTALLEPGWNLIERTLLHPHVRLRRAARTAVNPISLAGRGAPRRPGRTPATLPGPGPPRCPRAPAPRPA